MPPHSKAGEVMASLCERLDQIKTANGYLTDITRVFKATERVPDKQPMPYALVRTAADSRTGFAMPQATRLRSVEVEVVFSAAADEQALGDVHVDVLRALGIGQDLPERKFSGLLEEQDEAAFEWAQQGQTTHSITISLGVTYVETYN